jgi:hypothetical protein
MEGGVIDRFRQPEYTGENRCLPCTVVNGLLATVLAAAVGAVGAAGGPVAGVAGAAAVLALSLASIALRGYLVPGTPTLTKRYFPPWLLALFGKEGTAPVVDDDLDIDPEAVLVEVGAIEECADRDDLCLTDGFRAEWREAMAAAEGADRGRLLDLLGVPETVETEEFGDAFRVRADGVVVGTWESRAAFVADLAAARALSDRHDRWADLPVRARGQLLAGLRLFIDACPDCGATPTLGTETVESCCSTREVAAVSCPGCGARLFESPV